MAPSRSARVQFRFCASAIVVALPCSGFSAWAQAPGDPTPGVSTATGQAVTSQAVTSQADTQDALEATFWKGDELFQQGSYAEAAFSFTKALELSQLPGVTDTWRDFSPHIAFNVAHSYRLAGNCEAAKMAFAHYEGLVHTLPTEHVEWHASLLQDCSSSKAASTASDKVHSTHATAEATEPPAAALAEPTASGTWLLDVNTTPPTAMPEDTTATDTSRVVGWSAAGAAVVSVGLAGAFWVSANHQEELADGKRLWAEAQEYENSATTRRVVAGVLAGVGLALGGTSVYLLTQPSAVASSRHQSGVATLALRSDGTNISFWGQF